jgi:hypothetical protein
MTVREIVNQYLIVNKYDGLWGDGCGCEVATGGILNVPWVEWLQGFPIMFTDCAPSATHKSLCPPHSRFDYWLDCCRRMLDDVPASMTIERTTRRFREGKG